MITEKPVAEGQGQGDPTRPPKTGDAQVSIPGVDGQGNIEAPPSQMQSVPPQTEPDPEIGGSQPFLEQVKEPPAEPELEAAKEQEPAPQQAPQKEASEYAHITRDNFLTEMGYKNFADAAKTMKHQHATITKKSEKEKQLERELQEVNAALDQQYQQPPAQAGQGQEEEIDIFEHPEKIDQKIETVSQRTWRNMKVQDNIAEVRGEDPQTWDILVRGGFINEALNKNPRFNYTGISGVRGAKAEGIKLMRNYSQSMNNIMQGDQPQTPPTTQTGETEEQIRNRILREQQDAKAATLPQGGSARGVKRDINAEKQSAIKENDPFKLAEILLEGMA